MSVAKLRRSVVPIFGSPFAALAVAAILLHTDSVAQNNDLDLRRLPWDIFAETMDFDGRTSTYIYTGVQFSQGNISIQSDEGRATLNANTGGSWTFVGNVIIDVNDGRIESHSADLTFDGDVLVKAIVSGTPASFQLRRSGADDTTYAQAQNLTYDVQKGIIEFSGEAIITEAGNQISSNFLLYNIVERRISADSAGSADDRVRMTYTPADDSDDSGTRDIASESENK